MLQAGYAPEEIGEALAALRAGGLSAQGAKDKGYSPGSMAAAGYTPAETGGLLEAMKEDGFTAFQAKEAEP